MLVGLDDVRLGRIDGRGYRRYAGCRRGRLDRRRHGRGVRPVVHDVPRQLYLYRGRTRTRLRVGPARTTARACSCGRPCTPGLLRSVRHRRRGHEDLYLHDAGLRVQQLHLLAACGLPDRVRPAVPAARRVTQRPRRRRPRLPVRSRSRAWPARRPTRFASLRIRLRRSERGCICMADGLMHCGSVNHWFVNNNAAATTYN